MVIVDMHDIMEILGLGCVEVWECGSAVAI